MELIKIGDTAVSEQKVVETTPINSPEEEKKAEKKSTSTKKAKSKATFTLFLSNVKPLEI